MFYLMLKIYFYLLFEHFRWVWAQLYKQLLNEFKKQELSRSKKL